MPEKSENEKTEVAKLKGKMGTAKAKVSRVVNKLKISVLEFTELH